ncbi:glycoside hydrolase family 9 protein [Cohnella sp. GbtcB17]|uniref:InlB B-repeat-containing protein n=1 Tax=Cohnella sp. GbtcB17 TaxID=2824762 RepID=UPI0020C6DB35|nr:glycoside hydrolase family 9 protein [Cohnella sp. GbtcB17]
MVKNRLRRARRAMIVWLTALSMVLPFSSAFGTEAPPASGGQATALKERAPVAYIPQVSHANVLNSQWMEYVLVDNPYVDANVTNTDYYTITSSNDPNFSGDGVKPVLVNYRYFPEQAPYNPTMSGNIGKIQVFYRAYLKLPSSVKFQEGKTYTLTIDPAVATVDELNFTFSLSEPNLMIHTNQVGYPAEGKKVAYLNQWTGQGSLDFSGYPKFYIVAGGDATSVGKSVYSGDILPQRDDKTGQIVTDRWTKSVIYEMDFSTLKAEGTYRLYIPGIGVSYPFKIDSLIYKDEIAYTITRALYLQRDGDYGIDYDNHTASEYTHWHRPPSHMDDAIDQAEFIDNGGDLEKARVDLTGGHMDAGDRGKYPYNSAYVGIDMLLGAKYFPEQIKALGESLQIPESGNGVPDYLDELAYELDWLTKAINNTTTDGTLANYLRPQTPGKPNEGTYETGAPLTGATNRFFYNRTQGPNVAETLFAAGVLAQAYNTPLMQEYLSGKSNGYLKAAIRAYNGFKKHYYYDLEDPEYKTDIDALKTNTYYDVSQDGVPYPWANEMLLTASALLVAMGDNNYVEDPDVPGSRITAEELLHQIQEVMPKRPTQYDTFKRYTWVLDRAWLGVFVSMYENPRVTAEQRQWAYNCIIDFVDREMKHQTPFGASTQDEGFPDKIGWRFTSSTLMPIIVGYGLTGDQKYLDRIQQTWDYTLGSNAVSRSFITGLGDPQREPRWFVHEINQYQWVQEKTSPGNGWIEPPPGLPNSDIQSAKYPSWFSDTWNTEAKTKAFPKYEDHAVMYRYTDSWNTQNEFSVNILSANAASMLPLIPVETRTLSVESVYGDVLPAGGTYTKGMQLNLTAKGHVGYKFTHWSGDIGSADSTASSIPVTMDTNREIVANYEPVAVRTLSATATAGGTVKLDHADGRYSDRDVASLTAVPTYGYKFVRWEGDVTGVNPSAQIEMTDDLSVHAVFEVLPRHALNTAADSNKGSVKVNPSKPNYVHGDEVILTAVDRFGYRFDGWTEENTDTEVEKTYDGNPATVIVDAPKLVTANFIKVPEYTLDVETLEGGTVKATADNAANVSGKLYEEGTKATLTATAQPGYLFTGWTGAVTSSANPLEVTMDGSKAITANFKPANALMSVDISPPGTPGTTSVSGDVYTLTTTGKQFAQAPDSFRYLLRPGLKGNAVFTAKLDSLTASGKAADAVAGIQIRSSLASGAQYAAILAKDGKLIVQSRKGGDWYSADKTIEAVSAPVWLRIERTINRDLTMSWSTDGVTWKDPVKLTIWDWDKADMELTIGLFASAGPEGGTATAQFSHVSWPDMRTLTVNADGNGSVSAASGLYVADSKVKLTALPELNYTFTGWSGALEGKVNPAYLKMDSDKTVTATFDDMPKVCKLTVVQTTGGTIEIENPSADGGYEPYAKVNIKATPALGYRFVHWEGDLVGTTSNTVELIMDGHKTISAKFAAYKDADIGTTYAGSTTDDTDGVTIKASGSTVWGSSDSFRYTYEDNLSGDGAIVAKVNDFAATAGDARAGVMMRQSTAANSNYQGIFISKDRKVYSQYRDGSYVIREYLADEAVSGPVWLKVEKTGTSLKTYSSTDGTNWTQRGSRTIASFSGAYTAGLAVTAGQDSKFVTARFGEVKWPAIPSYTLHTEAVNGIVSATPSVPAYPAGYAVTLKATAADGYVFTGWSGDLRGNANPATVTMTGNKNITANFRNASDVYTLTTEAVNGTIQRGPDQEGYAAGASVTLTATPAPDYAFIGWSGGGLSGNANPATVIMDENKIVTAKFVEIKTPQSKDNDTKIDGSTSQSGASVTMTAAGTGIWGQTDRFRYAYVNIQNGDATIVAKVASVSVPGGKVNSDTKVGLMIRQSKDANSAFQGIFTVGGTEVSSIYRDQTNAWAAKNTDSTTANTWPIWLKVEKTGNIVKTYSSVDGVEWTLKSSRTMTITGEFTAGLAVSSGTEGKLAEVTFDTVIWP